MERGMSRHRKSDGAPTKRLRARGPRDGGHLNGRVEQETRFATMTANGTIITKRSRRREFIGGD